MNTAIPIHCKKCGFVMGTKRIHKHKGLCQKCWAKEVRKLNKRSSKRNVKLGGKK